MTKKSNKKASNFNFADFIDENRMPIIVLVIILMFFGFVFWQSNANKINLAGVDKNKIISNTDQSGGIEEHVYAGTSKNSKVTLIQYGDFQCPSCATVSPKLNALAKKYGEKITIIYRNFPLSGHQNALSAAAAAEAAGLQGKYLEMHDLLYEKQTEWGSANATERTELYKQYAKEVGVSDLEKFISDMKSANVSKKINYDKALGTAAKITGTPSFFLNGEELTNEVWGDDEALAAKIDGLLK